MSVLTLSPSSVRTAPRSGAAPAHLTGRGRVVLVMAMALLLAGWVAFVGRAPVQATSVRDGRPVLTYVTVHAGDTLWQIARRIAPRTDPRDTVDRIVEINGLRGGAVAAGQRIAVPTR